jgi:uncharacterized protein (DUF924 family)
MITMIDLNDLYDLCNYWYFSTTTKKYLKFDTLTSIDIYNQWCNIWFVKGLQQKQIDNKLKNDYEYMIEKYINYEPQNLYEIVGMIILYDQITRNIYRSTPNAYKYDKISYKLAKQLNNSINSNTFSLCIQLTINICLLHSENIHDQNIVQDNLQKIKLNSKCDYSLYIALFNISKNHLDRIKLFNRFPERNKIVGRISTHDELVYMSSIVP